MTDRTGAGGQDLGGVPSSRAERLAWQRQAAALLGKMLERAAAEGLPPIAWTVRESATLAGHCRAAGRDERRQEFTAWRDAMSRWAGQTADDERHTDSLGTVRLWAQWERYERVHVTIAAEIHAEDEL